MKTCSRLLLLFVIAITFPLLSSGRAYGQVEARAIVNINSARVDVFGDLDGLPFIAKLNVPNVDSYGITEGRFGSAFVTGKFYPGGTGSFFGEFFKAEGHGGGFSPWGWVFQDFSAPDGADIFISGLNRSFTAGTFGDRPWAPAGAKLGLSVVEG